MKYQLNPLLESTTYKNARFLGAGLSALSSGAGYTLIKYSDPKKILLIKDEIINSPNHEVFFALCKKYDIGDEDLMYYHKKYHYSLDELKEYVAEKLDKLYKEQVINKRVGYALVGAGTAGSAYSTPSVIKAIKWAVRH